MPKRCKGLTDLDLRKKLKPQDKDYWVRDGDGLALRVYPTGAKNWHYIYTNNDGKKCYLPLGEYPDIGLADARQRRDDARRQLANGIDPLIERRTEKHEHKIAKTISDLTSDYIEKHAKVNKPKSWQEDERILNKDIIPLWGELKAKDIKQEDVIELVAAIRPRGAAITLNTYKIVRKMFNYAKKNKIIKESPCDGLTQTDDDIPTVPSRDRILSDDEIRTFWHGLDKASMSDATKRALKMILITCQRPGEVISMHSTEIDGDWWTFKPKATRITKETPRDQRIYLTATAKALIGDAKGYIFPSPKEDEVTHKNEAMLEKSIAGAIRKNLKEYKRQRPARTANAGDVPRMVKVKESRKINMQHFRPHDLRRTGATNLSKLKFSDEIVDAILAHLKKGTIKIYNRYLYDEPKREAMLAWEKRLLEIVNGKPENEKAAEGSAAIDYCI